MDEHSIFKIFVGSFSAKLIKPLFINLYMIVKILGGIDALAGILFLMLALGYNVQFYIIWIFAVILFLKGLFIFTGEFILSPIDLASSIILMLSNFLTIPIFLFWVISVLMFVKGSFSFL